jgi:hypothetical protein
MQIFYFMVVLLVLTFSSVPLSDASSSSVNVMYPKYAAKHQKLTNYFKKNGSPVPDKMAHAVLATKRPRLMAAKAIIETHGDPSKRNTGYKKRHHGAWQVCDKWWGPVSTEVSKQAIQAEDVFDVYLKSSKGDWRTALSKYGGDSSSKYAISVLNEMNKVPKI